jgi:hypothetical protein
MRIAGFLFLALAACSSNPTTPADAATDQMVGADDGVDGGGTNPMCTAVVEQLLKPVDMVSTGMVSVISDMNGVKTIYVDASAGGIPNMDANPRVYVNLETGTRVDVSDVGARTSTAWDLAIKRVYFFTNGGDGGPGMGAALFVSKAFDQVTMADAMKTFAVEHFVDQDCNPLMDATGGLLTTFDGWYDYDMMTHIPTPKPNLTFIVKGATGKLYKLAILSYAASPDGGQGMSTGFYSLKVAAL